MKQKIILLITLIFIVCGCTTRKEDVNHAIIIVEGADEKSIYSSVNADNDKHLSGEEYALENSVSIFMNDYKKLHILFICDACDHKEEYEVSGQTELFIQCDCPEEGDSNGNIKEYINIIVSMN